MPSDRCILSGESNKIAPLPDFHGNQCSLFDSDRRFAFTLSAICRSGGKLCPGIRPRKHVHVHRKDSGCFRRKAACGPSLCAGQNRSVEIRLSRWRRGKVAASSSTGQGHRKRRRAFPVPEQRMNARSFHQCERIKKVFIVLHLHGGNETRMRGPNVLLMH